MTLTGILKNILLLIASVMIWGTAISALQFLGYGIALAGLVYYSAGWEQIVSTSTGLWVWLKNVWESPGSSESRLPPAIRRALFTGLAVITVITLTAGFFYGGGTSTLQLS